MAFIPISNACEVVFFMRAAGQEIRNVAHFTVTTPPYTGPELDDLLTLLTTWLTTWRTTVPSSIEMYQLSAKALNVENGVQRIRSVSAVGSNAGSPEPNNVTVAVKKVTGVAGRSFRGRWYHPQMTEGDAVHNVVLPAFATAIRNLYNQLNTLTGGFVHHLAVASRFANGVPRVVGVATEVIDHTVEPTIDSQRRRLPGRGA